MEEDVENQPRKADEKSCSLSACCDKRWKDIRLMWREFDPIGVYYEEGDELCDWPDDEYDCYVTHTHKLLQENVDHAALVAYITHVCQEVIGMNTPAKRIDRFAAKLVSRFQKKEE